MNKQPPPPPQRDSLLYTVQWFIYQPIDESYFLQLNAKSSFQQIN